MNEDVIEYVRWLENRVQALEFRLSVIESERRTQESQTADDKRQEALRDLTGPLTGMAAAFEQGKSMRRR